MSHEIENELEAMKTMAAVLQPLDEDARSRVLEWALKRFEVTASTPRDLAPPHEGNQRTEFNDFVDLFDAANPATEAQRALVGAYWIQELKGEGTFSSERVNMLLKDMGRGVSNITRTLSRLQSANPALVRQVAKSGRSQQARKTYKLTTAGVREVARMLSNSSDDGAGLS